VQYCAVKSAFEIAERARTGEEIVLHDIEGWSVGEIADLESVTMSAIKSRLSRGRERLRDIYTRRFGVRAAFVPGKDTP
jgi:DNA-directed RNA polymerase specialized sigma24 family protein